MSFLWGPHQCVHQLRYIFQMIPFWWTTKPLKFLLLEFPQNTLAHFLDVALQVVGSPLTVSEEDTNSDHEVALLPATDCLPVYQTATDAELAPAVLSIPKLAQIDLDEFSGWVPTHAPFPWGLSFSFGPT